MNRSNKFQIQNTKKYVYIRMNKSLNGLIESFIKLELDFIHEIGPIKLGKGVLDVGLGGFKELLYFLDH
jgi:hypothetical protein